MSKIFVSQALQPGDCEIFLCSNHSNSNENLHIVEDPFICPNQNCQQMICKTCYFTCKKCPVCKCPFETPSGNISEPLKVMLNQLILRCENHDNGCLVEIPYEKYRSHTKNCRYKEIMPKIEDIPTFKPIDNPEKPTNSFPIFKKTLNSLNNLMNPPPSNPYVFKPIEPPPDPIPIEKTTSIDILLQDYKKTFEENLSLSQMKMLITKSVADCERKEDLQKVVDFYHDSFKKTNKQASKVNNFQSMDSSISEGSSEDSEESKESEKKSEKSEKGNKEKLNTSGKLYFQSLPDRVLKKFRQSDFSYLQVDDLKVILERRNLLKAGNKEDLINRLREYLSTKYTKKNCALPDKQHKIKKAMSKEEKLKLFQKILKEFK